MRENRDFVVPVNILTTFAHAPFSWAARHTTVCLDEPFKKSLHNNYFFDLTLGTPNCMYLLHNFSPKHSIKLDSEINECD